MKRIGLLLATAAVWGANRPDRLEWFRDQGFATWKQDGRGLYITATTAQRLYDDRRWPQPVALRITHPEPALQPPQVLTRGARWEAEAWILEGELRTLGDASRVEVGFQYRPRKGLTDLYEKTEPWRDLPLEPREQAGVFRARLTGVGRSEDHEFRALVRHPLLTLYGQERPLAPDRVLSLHD